MRDGSSLLWRCVGIMAALAGAAAPSAGQDRWWNYHWTHRRAVTVSDVPKTGLAGDEVGVVTMPTGGLVQPDGRDIRVTTAAGQIMPHRTLMTGPGDRTRIAFALRSPVRKYFVYFGNAKAKKPAEELEIRRGVLMQTWAYQRGGIANLRQVKRIFSRADKLIGRDFREGVFLGHNPFGPQSKLASLFTGYLVCRTEGEYVFSTSSRDASFLLIDGEVVVANGGRHRPQRRAVRRGRVRLTKGLHELKVYHVCAGGNPAIVAAWREPGGRRLWKIPPDAFAPVRRAKPGIMERYGRELHADFIPVHAGETFLANRYFQRYTFEARLKGRFAGKCVCKWDFGDRQRASTTRCEHVYLRDGQYKVSLTVKAGGQTLKRTNVIHVSRPWDRVTRNILDGPAEHARIVSNYDFAAADSRDIAGAVVLFKRTGLRQAIIRAGDALIKRDKAPAAVLRDAMPVYAEALVRTAKDPARAVAALLKASKMTSAPDVAAEMMVLAGRTALAAGEPDRAMSIFSQAVKKYAASTTRQAIREARIGIGDVWRRRGNYAKAMAAYRSAGPVKHQGHDKQAVRKGDLARHAEDYLRRRMFNHADESLDKWEYEFPADKLDGFSTLIRVRLATARKHYAAAAAQAEELVRVNPRSNYAAELLMLAAKAYGKLGKTDLARRTLRRIVEDYPESPLAAKAKENLNLK